MKSFEERYNELYEDIQAKLLKLIRWKGTPSKHVQEDCLFLDSDDTGYSEIVFINDRITLIDKDGCHFWLSCIEFEKLCKITDDLGFFNPYDSDAVKMSVRILNNPDISLSKFGNFSVTGDPDGMRQKYYGKGALLVRDGNFIYNVTEEPHIYFEHAKETQK